MVLLKLKDINIVDFRENTVNFDVFSGTFSPDETVNFTDLELIADNGLRYVLSARSYSYYGTPVGLGSLTGFIKRLLGLVSSGEAAEMTLARFVNEVVAENCECGVIFTIYDGDSNILGEGFIPVYSYSTQAYLEAVLSDREAAYRNYKLVEDLLDKANSIVTVADGDEIRVESLTDFINL